jgi:hypothetical protein
MSGVAIAVVGLLLVASQLLYGAGLPFSDHALDAEHSVAMGEVVGVERIAGRDVTRVTFRYTVNGIARERASYAVGPGPTAQRLHPVEYLRRDHGTSRLRFTTVAVPPFVSWQVSTSVSALGVLLLLVWLRMGARQRLHADGIGGEPA